MSCYGGFRPTGEPRKDTTRLGLMCGPINGMSLATDALLEGKLAPGTPPVTHSFAARRGECYRIFATAGGTVADLDVTVRSSRGTRLASDQSEDGWPIVDPDRPFCTFESDTFTVEFRAPKGTGPFAAQVWRLPARKGD